MIYWPEQQKGHFFKVMLKKVFNTPLHRKMKGCVAILVCYVYITPSLQEQFDDLLMTSVTGHL